MPLEYNNDDGAQALDQQQELDFRRGWQVVDAASGSNVVTDGTGTYEVDVAAGDINTPTGTVSCPASTLDLQSLVDPDLPRIVIVYRDGSGVAQTLAGTPAAKQPTGETAPGPIYQPAPDAFSTTDGVVLATVLLEAAASSVGSGQIRDRRMPASLNVDSAEVGSLSAAGIIIDSTVRYVSSDTELDDALASANGGDMIILGNATYTTDRTISEDLCFVGSHDQFGSVIDSTWTLEGGIKIQNTGISGGSGNFTVNSRNCTIESCSGDPTVTVSANNFRFLNNIGGGITFESGTTGGIVDGCSGTSVTDNGTNTVGDIAP